jgi:hypothetical protein
LEYTQSLGELLDRAIDRGQFSEDSVLSTLLVRQLQQGARSALRHRSYPDQLLDLGEVVAGMGGMQLLELLRLHLPLPTPRTIRSWRPPPLVESGVMAQHYTTLLNICAFAGATGLGRPVPMTVYAGGQLVVYDLALAIDGLQLAAGIGLVAATNTITGFLRPLDAKLEAEILHLPDAASIKHFEKSHDIFVAGVQVGILTRVDGACRGPVITEYTGRSNDTAASKARVEKVLQLTKSCAECISASAPCERRCSSCENAEVLCQRCHDLEIDPSHALTLNRPCRRCQQLGRMCLLGRVVTVSTDCASGESR